MSAASARTVLGDVDNMAGGAGVLAAAFLTRFFVTFFFAAARFFVAEEDCLF